LVPISEVSNGENSKLKDKKLKNLLKILILKNITKIR